MMFINGSEGGTVSVVWTHAVTGVTSTLPASPGFPYFCVHQRNFQQPTSSSETMLPEPTLLPHTEDWKFPPSPATQ